MVKKLSAAALATGLLASTSIQVLANETEKVNSTNFETVNLQDALNNVKNEITSIEDLQLISPKIKETEANETKKAAKHVTKDFKKAERDAEKAAKLLEKQERKAAQQAKKEERKAAQQAKREEHKATQQVKKEEHKENNANKKEEKDKK